MTSKTLFLKQKELCEQLSAVVHTDWFKQCLVFVKGELMEQGGISTEMLRGAQMFEQALLEFTDEEPDPAQFPSTGIKHDLDVKPRYGKTTTSKSP
jgi:hypothetical protein